MKSAGRNLDPVAPICVMLKLVLLELVANACEGRAIITESPVIFLE